jgi:MarR family transcriptional regulator, organic hydroperoxide resistance regulator
MVGRRKPSVEGPLPARAGRARVEATTPDMPVDDFLWNIVAISNHFEDISFAWAQMLGVNVHQWMILMAVRDLDRGTGVSVKAVSLKLHSDSSFVTAQSKGLEKLGFLKREASSEDARVVLMSLTPKAVKEVTALRARREPLRQSVFDEMSDRQLADINATLAELRAKLERAAKRLAAEL